MAILNSHGVLYVDSIPTHTPTAEQARLARLENTATFYYYDNTQWVLIDLDALVAQTDVQSVTGPNVDNTDPQNPIVNLQTAAQTSVVDAGGNYTATDVEGVLAEIAVNLSGLISTAITNIDLRPTANPNEYTVEIEWTDGNGVAQVTTDPTPVTISGLTNLSYTASPTDGTVSSDTGTNAIIPAGSTVNASLMLPGDKTKLDFITVTQPVDLDDIETKADASIQTVTDTNSVNLTKTGNDLSADVNISATQGAGMTVTTEPDGIRVSYAEAEPTGYLSRALALAALGAGQKFQYLPANLDGAVQGTVAYT